MSLLASNPTIREVLLTRLVQLDLLVKKDANWSYSAIMKDAVERAPHLKFQSTRLSRWIAGELNQLTDIQIAWLCVRYCIHIPPQIIKAVITSEVECLSAPYSELDAISRLNQFFKNDSLHDNNQRTNPVTEI